MSQTTNIRRKMNRSLILWVGSYLLILIVPLVLGTLMYANSVRLLSEEVEKVHAKAFAELQWKLDTVLEEAQRLGDTLAMSDKVTEAATTRQPLDQHAIAAAAQVQSSIATALLSADGVRDIAVYFENVEYAVTAGRSARGDLIGPLIETELDLPWEDWLAFVQESGLSAYHMTESGNVYYVRGIITRLNPGRRIGAVVVAVSPGFLKDHLEASAGVIGGDAWILAPKGLALASNPEAELPGALLEGELPAEDSGFILTRSPSGIADFVYASAVSQEIVWHSVRSIRRLICVYLILCLGVGVTLSYLLARRYYNPVRRMSALLSMHETEDRKDTDEMKFIQSALSRLVEKSVRQDSTITEQEKKLRDLSLRRLLEGSADTPRNQAIAFAHPLFVVVIFQMERDRDLFTLEPISPGAPADGLAPLEVLRDMVSRILGEQIACYCVVSRTKVYAVLNLPEDRRPGVKARITALCGRVRDACTELFGQPVNVGISPVYEGVEGIAMGARQAREVIEHIDMLGQERVIIHYEDLTPALEDDFINHELTALERKVCDGIRAGQIESARYTLGEVFKSYHAATIQSARIVKIRLFGLVSMLLEAFAQSPFDADVVDDLLRGAHVFQYKSVQQMQEALQEVFRELGRLHEDGRRPPIRGVLEEVKAYIAENYHDPDLGVAGIAETFSMNASYLSRSFKKQEGVNLLDHIHGVRIEKAKEYLEKGYSVKDVAEMTGYLGSLSMIRVFKRYEGVTPGKYGREGQ